jgi:hypothetical protein
MDNLLHDDIYEVVKVNPEGKKFERVNRIVCKGHTYETDLVLDIASEVYSLKEGDKVAFAIATTLRLDGKPEEDTFNQDGKVRRFLRCFRERRGRQGARRHTFDAHPSYDNLPY